MNEHEIKLIKLKLHFKYCFWILIVCSCIVGGLSLYNQKFAISGLSNAALLLSIVLAVIAILITLWDVAGQKNIIGDIREQINSIKEITDDIKESAESSNELVSRLEDFDSRFGVNFEPIKAMLDTISDKIESSSLAPEVGDVKSAVEELKKMVTNKEKDLSQLKHSIDSETSNNKLMRERVFNQTLTYVNQLDKGERFSRNEIVSNLFKELKVSGIQSSFINKAIVTLIDSRIIEEFEGNYIKR